MEKHEVITLNEKALLQVFPRDPEVSVKLAALFSCQSESIQNTRERIAVLPDTVACNRPQRHTTSWLHGESGMHEDEG